MGISTWFSSSVEIWDVLCVVMFSVQLNIASRSIDGSMIVRNHKLQRGSHNSVNEWMMGRALHILSWLSEDIVDIFVGPHVDVLWNVSGGWFISDALPGPTLKATLYLGSRGGLHLAGNLMFCGSQPLALLFVSVCHLLCACFCVSHLLCV